MWKSLISVKIFRTCAQLSRFSIFDTIILLPTIMAVIMGWPLLTNYSAVAGDEEM